MKHVTQSLKRVLSLLMVVAMMLALLPAAAFAADTTTLYLKPNGNWLKDGARFAAYFYGNGDKWVSMTDSNGDGVYEVEAPAGYPNVIFCRMNPSSTTNSWNNKWNQTGDLTIPTDGKNMYTINEGQWDSGQNGKWSVYTYVPPLYTVAGTLSAVQWSPADGERLTDEDADGIFTYTYTNVAKGSYEFKVTNGTWNASWPATNYKVTVEEDGSDVTVIFDAVKKTVSASVVKTYSVTFIGANVTSDGLSVAIKGETYTATLTPAEGYDLPETVNVTMDGAAVEHTWDAATGALSVPNVTGNLMITAEGVEQAKYLYLKPNTNWTQADARFAAYFFGNGEMWVSMTDVNFDGIYEVKIPEGYPNVIFCRMNPGTTANNWNNKWNQTGDLVIPADGNNMYTVKSGTWDNGGGSWSVYVPTGAEPVFTVAGAAGLCGTDWDVSNTANDMVKKADGTYEKVFTNVAAGTYEYKVVLNHSWNRSWGNGSANAKVTVAENGQTVTITFDPAALKVSSTVTTPVEPDPTPDPDPEPTKDYYLVGYINNADYNGNDYKFVDGKLTVTFTNDSYVVVKDGSGDWYLCQSYCTDTSAVLTKGHSEKMFVAAGTEWTFTLVENGDGTLTLSHAKSQGGNEPAGDVEYEATFHFANTLGWGVVNLYSWIGTGTTLTGGWPGTATTLDENGFYSMTVKYTAPAGESLNFIFNNGGAQTVDLSIPASEFVDNKVEKWVILTTQTDGKYNADILASGDAIAISPTVDGTSVNFQYNAPNATAVYVAGSFNGWSTTATAMTKNEHGIWSVTVENLTPGVHEYKFVVDGNWFTDPMNSWIENENSAFMILDPNAVDENKVTVNIHYTRADGKYDGWNFHLWNENGDIQDTSVLTENGLVATLVFDHARGVRSVSVIPRFSTADNKWSAQEATFYIDLSNIVSGTVDYYITSGSNSGRRVLGLDVALGNKLSDVELDYDTGKIHVTIAKPVAGAQFGITGGSDDETTYTLYFQNNWVWSDINIYYWGSAGTNPSWPGVPMTKVGNDGTHDIYMANIPVDVEGVIINGLKDDNSGNRDQTPDIKSGFADGLCYFMQWNNGNAVGTFQYATAIAVTDVTGSGNSYILTLSQELELSQLHQYKVVFEGYEYAIDISGAYASDKFAEEFTYEGDDLGATWAADQTIFRVWTPTAESINVLLYASGTQGTDDLIKSVPMTRDVNGTWVATVAGNLNGTYYTYEVNVGGKTVEAVDPYARTTGVNGERGMVIDLDSTDPEGWEEDTNPNPITSYTDAIIYELHVRDFSIDSSSGIMEDYMGKFLAFTQTGTTVNGEKNGLSTGIDYLKSLGVTHIHLLPVYDYGSVDETTCSNFNWGYDPVNYNVPEGSYSTDPYKGEVRVEEFKLMVQALHEAGISVVMDVVYNHVYDAGKFGFNNIVPGYFSRPDSNTSGCGNDTASEREMVSKYIVDSVAYWTEEYHIDGFRFDLVGLIDIVTIGNIVDIVHNDLNRPDVIFYGEGWNMDGTNSEPGTEMAKQGNADKTPGFAYFSDSIRNQIAGSNGSTLGFVSGGGMGNLAAYFLAQPEAWGETWTNNPGQVVQYASCHDNYTLIDKLIISTGAPGLTDDVISMNNLAAAIYMTAQGIPFIHAGEEMLREKLEEDGGRCENSYNATDYVNSIKWDNLLKEEYADTMAYYQGLIAFRKAHAALRMETAADVAANVQTARISDSLLAFLFDGNATGDDDVLVIFNAGAASTVVTLPEGTWNVCVDSEDAGTETLYTAQTAVQIDGISAMILTREDEGVNEDQTSGGSASDTITLYFSNNKYWSKVYAHYWGGSEATNWPGVEMTWVEKNGYGEDIYKVTIPANSTGIIFHNNSGAQTADLTPGADGTGYYCNTESGGKWTCGTYTYAPSGSAGGSAGFSNDGIYEGESQYFLFGYINGQDYACEGGSEAMGKYQFVDGKLTVFFETDSYVGVKTTGTKTWSMTKGWLGNVASATLYNSNTLGAVANKLMIPGGVEVTFTLTKNTDGTLTLSYEAENNGPVDGTGIQNGATLHCWNWSFAEIEANMALIAEMGFTAIQTSPIQPLKESTTDATDTVSGCWWLYYQPVGFTITDGEGNALGTKADLEKMIATAHKYGIKVIVDVVANHLANKTGNDLSDAIASELLASEYWHDITVNTKDYTNRFDVTQHCMSGLPDLNTGNADIQQFVLDFLKQCIDLGVDGFRFDGTKHIETPDDELYFESDFWPFVIGGAETYASEQYNKDIYVYGEVLDGTTGYAISDYTEFMAVTDNSWGNTLRDNVAGGNAALVPGYDKPTDASNLVVWAESHDTYANGSSANVSAANINKVWALIAARAEAMGLYFARPADDNQLLGVGSVTGWYNEVVKAANRFHSMFVGHSELLGNEDGISYVLRGNSGIVLVNVKGNEAQVELSVPMENGTYLDQLTGNTFTVENGTITGTIGETGIAVIHDVAYSVSTEQNDGGSVEVDNTNPIASTEVTVTVKTDIGMAISNVKVLDRNGNEVAVTDLGNGVYTFVQPVGGATVVVEFVYIEYTIYFPDAAIETATSNDAPIYGEEVTLTIKPVIGWAVKSLALYDAEGNQLELVKVAYGTYTYVQPACDVYVEVECELALYTIYVEEITGGEVLLRSDKAYYLDTVTFEVSCAPGNEVESVVVMMPDGQQRQVTDNGDGTYSYLHPAMDVMIKVTFRTVGAPVDPTEPTEPSEPTQPSEPTEPSQPTEPSEPTEPTQPTQPTEPAEPTQPTQPTQPQQPTEEPAGNNGLWIVIAVLAVVAAAVVVFVIIKRKKA